MTSYPLPILLLKNFNNHYLCGRNSTRNKLTLLKMNNKVKIKIVVSYPDEVITTLTDLIQKGEVNVVLFQDYQEKISPDVLEEKLSQSFNLTTG